MTEEQLRKIEQLAEDVVAGTLIGMGLNKAYNLAAIEVPALLHSHRDLSEELIKTQERLRQCLCKPH